MISASIRCNHASSKSINPLTASNRSHHIHSPSGRSQHLPACQSITIAQNLTHLNQSSGHSNTQSINRPYSTHKAIQWTLLHILITLSTIISIAVAPIMQQLIPRGNRKLQPTRKGTKMIRKNTQASATPTTDTNPMDQPVAINRRTRLTRHQQRLDSLSQPFIQRKAPRKSYGSTIDPFEPYNGGKRAQLEMLRGDRKLHPQLKGTYTQSMIRVMPQEQLKNVYEQLYKKAIESLAAKSPNLLRTLLIFDDLHSFIMRMSESQATQLTQSMIRADSKLLPPERMVSLIQTIQSHQVAEHRGKTSQEILTIASEILMVQNQPTYNTEDKAKQILYLLRKCDQQSLKRLSRMTGLDVVSLHKELYRTNSRFQIINEINKVNQMIKDLQIVAPKEKMIERRLAYLDYVRLLSETEIQDFLTQTGNDLWSMAQEVAFSLLESIYFPGQFPQLFNQVRSQLLLNYYEDISLCSRFMPSSNAKVHELNSVNKFLDTWIEWNEKTSTQTLNKWYSEMFDNVIPDDQFLMRTIQRQFVQLLNPNNPTSFSRSKQQKKKHFEAALLFKSIMISQSQALGVKQSTKHIAHGFTQKLYSIIPQQNTQAMNNILNSQFRDLLAQNNLFSTLQDQLQVEMALTVLQSEKQLSHDDQRPSGPSSTDTALAYYGLFVDKNEDFKNRLKAALGYIGLQYETVKSELKFFLMTHRKLQTDRKFPPPGAPPFSQNSPYSMKGYYGIETLHYPFSMNFKPDLDQQGLKMERKTETMYYKRIISQDNFKRRLLRPIIDLSRQEEENFKAVSELDEILEAQQTDLEEEQVEPGQPSGKERVIFTDRELEAAAAFGYLNRDNFSKLSRFERRRVKQLQLFEDDKLMIAKSFRRQTSDQSQQQDIQGQEGEDRSGQQIFNRKQRLNMTKKMRALKKNKQDMMKKDQKSIDTGQMTQGQSVEDLTARADMRDQRPYDSKSGELTSALERDDEPAPEPLDSQAEKRGEPGQPVKPAKPVKPGQPGQPVQPAEDVPSTSQMKTGILKLFNKGFWSQMRTPKTKSKVTKEQAFSYDEQEVETENQPSPTMNPESTPKPEAVGAGSTPSSTLELKNVQKGGIFVKRALKKRISAGLEVSSQEQKPFADQSRPKDQKKIVSPITVLDDDQAILQNIYKPWKGGEPGIVVDPNMNAKVGVYQTGPFESPREANKFPKKTSVEDFVEQVNDQSQQGTKQSATSRRVSPNKPAIPPKPAAGKTKPTLQPKPLIKDLQKTGFAGSLDSLLNDKQKRPTPPDTQKEPVQNKWRRGLEFMLRKNLNEPQPKKKIDKSKIGFPNNFIHVKNDGNQKNTMVQTAKPLQPLKESSEMSKESVSMSEMQSNTPQGSTADLSSIQSRKNKLKLDLIVAKPMRGKMTKQSGLDSVETSQQQRPSPSNPFGPLKGAFLTFGKKSPSSPGKGKIPMSQPGSPGNQQATTPSTPSTPKKRAAVLPPVAPEKKTTVPAATLQMKSMQPLKSPKKSLPPVPKKSPMPSSRSPPKPQKPKVIFNANIMYSSRSGQFLHPNSIKWSNFTGQAKEIYQKFYEQHKKQQNKAQGKKVQQAPKIKKQQGQQDQYSAIPLSPILPHQVYKALKQCFKPQSRK